MQKETRWGWSASVFGLSLLPLVTQIHAAEAAVITISTDLTDPQETATIDAGAPGDILIDTTGSITLTGGTALTINSDNTATNEGNISVDNVDGAVGVAILGGNTGSFINKNTVSLSSSVDETRATGKVGVDLSGGTFAGNIEIDTFGSVRVTGDNSFAIRTTGVLMGDFLNSGTIVSSGSDSYGVLVGNTIDGQFINSGSIESNVVVEDLDNDPETIEIFTTHSAVGIGGSITGGFLNDGLTEEEKNDDTPDVGIQFGTVHARGAPQAVLISPTLSSGGPADITLGAVAGIPTGEGFVNLGTIAAETQIGVPVTGIRIEGLSSGGTDYLTSLAGGFRNDGQISIANQNASATAVSIGPLVAVPNLTNHGTIRAEVGSIQNSLEAVALRIETTESTISLVNTGLIGAEAATPDPTAIAISDIGGMLTSIDNKGLITATTAELDDDGSLLRQEGIALDLSANTLGVSIHNEEDPTEDGELSGLIGGAILLGSGNDTITMESGSISGDINLAGGMDQIVFNGGTYAGTIRYGTGTGSFHLGSNAVFAGTIAPETSTISANINGDLTLETADTISLSSLTIGSTADITLPVGTAGATVANFDVAGTATVNSNATFTPDLLTVVTTAQTVDVVQAGTLNLIGGLPNLNTADAPFIYHFNLIDTGNLQLQITPKTPQELGITVNQLTLYAPLIEAAETDEQLTDVLHGIESQKELSLSLDRIMPNNTNAPYHLGIQSFEGMAESALNTDHRIDETTRHNTRFWAEESGFYRDQAALDDERGFIGRTFRLSGGFDVATSSLDRLGVALSVSFQGYKPDRAPTKPYNTTAVWLGGYTSKSFGNLELSGIAGFALTKNTSDRVIELEEDTLRAEGDWSGSQWAGRFQGDYTFGSDKLYLKPKASVTYFSMTEDSYEEDGDIGAAFMASDVTLTGVRAEGSAAVGFVLRSGATTYHTEFEAGYRQDSGSEENREYQFVNGTTPFELAIPGAEDGAATFGLSIFGQTNFTTLGFTYKGAFDGDNSDHSFRAVIRSRF